MVERCADDHFCYTHKIICAFLHPFHVIYQALIIRIAVIHDTVQYLTDGS